MADDRDADKGPSDNDLEVKYGWAPGDVEVSHPKKTVRAERRHVGEKKGWIVVDAESGVVLSKDLLTHEDALEFIKLMKIDKSV